MGGAITREWHHDGMGMGPEWALILGSRGCMVESCYGFVAVSVGAGVSP